MVIDEIVDAESCHFHFHICDENIFLLRLPSHFFNTLACVTNSRTAPFTSYPTEKNEKNAAIFIYYALKKESNIIENRMKKNNPNHIWFNMLITILFISWMIILNCKKSYTFGIAKQVIVLQLFSLERSNHKLIEDFS